VALQQHFESHWRGFLELQHLGNLLEADRAIRAALAASQPAPAYKIQTVLSEAAHLPWLPSTPAQVLQCARMALLSYVRDLLRDTLLAVGRALSLDAESKSDRQLKAVRLFFVQLLALVFLFWS
jgi:hypothetical protein